MFDRVKALLLASCKRFQRRSKNDNQHHAPATLRLPHELVNVIVDSLNISEAVCLSVCCKYFYHRLGKDRYRILRKGQGHEDQRNEFLLRLARDHPTLFFCHSCSRLRLVGSVGLPLVGSCGPRLRCMWLTDTEGVPLHSFEMYGEGAIYRLTFSHVQLVMARHRHGPKYGIPTSTLSITEIWKVDRLKVWCVLHVEPRIIDDELFLRVQHWIAFDRHQPPTLNGSIDPASARISTFTEQGVKNL